jgi:hypothetical protein
MLNKKEITLILLGVILLSLVINLGQEINKIGYILVSIFFIFLINITAKKITAYYLDSEIEIDFWKIKRYGFRTHQHFKKLFPAGIIFPFIFKIIFFVFTYFTWMAILIFNIKSRTYRAAKRFGLYTFSEMSEYHIGLIAASGIIANYLFIIIAYLIEIPIEMHFIELSIFFIFFNLLPLSNLDGNKIFFGSIVLWSFLAIITLISLLSIIIII